MQHEAQLFIKGMVCQRCITVVNSELQQLGLIPVKTSLGQVTVITTVQMPEIRVIEEKLEPLGFKLLEDKKIRVVKEIKRLVATVYSGEYEFPDHFRFSDLITEAFHKDYDKISALFSLVEHQTLEKYIIDYRIEKIKELLVYTSLTLLDIAIKLNYSSVAHLSRQFKQVTGLTPSYFKEVKKAKTILELSTNLS
ncbi:MAG TPA: AraC family transcriptional regulator [Flavisolibacter sp.]|jgi:AraC-like DNA-binding protein|nr:AraC family transcriptional regulator [Flavisolibacter sp.]